MAVPGWIRENRVRQNRFHERQLQASRPRLRTKGPDAREVAIPAYEARRLKELERENTRLKRVVADGDLHNNVQHHRLHDALIINVSSSKIRYGLVGIAFERVVLKVRND